MKLDKETVSIIEKRLQKLLPSILKHLECNNNKKAKEIEKAIRTICIDYANNKIIYSNAPSTSAVRKILTELKQHANSLHCLTNPDDIVSRVALSQSGLRKFPDVPHGRLLNYKDEDYDSLTLEMIFNPEFERFREYLSNLIITCDKADKVLTQTTNNEGEKLYLVNPKLELAKQCIMLAKWFNPGNVSSTVGGFLSRLVTYIYEIATGEQDKELEKPVKSAVVAWKNTSEFDDFKISLAKIHKKDIGS